MAFDTYNLKTMKDHTLTCISNSINYPLVKPKTVNLEITERCPLSCKTCNIKNKNYGAGGELPLEKLKDIVDQIKVWGVDRITLAGGETLVRKDDTIEIISHAAKSGIRTELITNGYFLDYETCDSLIKSGLTKLAISVDGSDAKTHDYIRGKGSFKKVIAATKNLVYLRKDSKIELEFTTTIVSYNFRQLVDIYNLLKKVGFDFINYQAFVPDNSFQKRFDYDSEFWIHENYIEELGGIIEKLIAIRRANGGIRNSENYLKLIPAYFKQKERFRPSNCLAGFRLLNVDAYGKISICGLGPNLSVHKNDLPKLWKMNEYKKTRKKIKGCRQPCLMLCYEKLGFNDLRKSFFRVK